MQRTGWGKEGDKCAQEKLLEQSQDDKFTLSVSIIIYTTLPIAFLPGLP